MTKLSVMPTRADTVHAASQLLLVSGLLLSTLVVLTFDGVSGLTVFTAAFALAFLVDVRARRRACGETARR